MFTTSQTAHPIAQPARFRRQGLIAWLVRWNAAARERARFERLDDAARRDMGLPAANGQRITIAEIMARTAR